jgi:copper chaperone CopZ
LKQTFVSTVALFSITFIARRYNLQGFLQSYYVQSITPQTWKDSLLQTAANLILPLLASACCMIQLFLNLLATGCAGFNTVLGPVRPFFLSLLIVLTCLQPHVSVTKSIVRWTIALLPEVVHWMNNQRRFSVASSQSVAVSLPVQAAMEVSIPSMGCVACINTIQGAVYRIPGVTAVTASMLPLGAKGGTAHIRLAASSSDDLVDVVTDVVEAIRNAGFDDAEVASVQERDVS